jgi:hypothetical protein
MSKLSSYLYGSVAFGAISLATTGAFAACTGPGAPTNTQTRCLTAIQIPGNALRSYDISWVNPDRAEYYLADRSNRGIDVIDTQHLTFKRTIGGFVGIVLNTAGTAVNNNKSGPDGVTSHGHWLYAGDGDSSLHVIDLDAPTASATKAIIFTGGTTRVDEMAMTTDGKLLLAANNAEDPPFATLFRANGDSATNTMGPGSIISKITVSPTIMPPGGAIEQPAWDPKTKRFYTSIPVILNNPTGCNPAVTIGPTACDGGLLVTDPTTVTPGLYVQGTFNPATNTGVVPLHACGPNGATVGPHDNLLLGCTPANNGNNVTTLVINATTKNYANIGNITGSDEVWYNSGDGRYYTASNRNCTIPGSPCPLASQQTAVLGVIDGTSVLIETIPQSSGSHSVAADSKRNLIFVPESAPAIPVLAGDTTLVGAGICGSTNGCIGVYAHDVDEDDEGHDHDGHDHDR